MADRTIKPDDTNDLVLQNNDGSAKLELNEDQTVKVTTGSDAGEDFTVNTSQLVVEGDSGNVGIGTSAPTSGYKLDVVNNGATGIRIGDTSDNSRVLSQLDNETFTTSFTKDGSGFNTTFKFKTQNSAGSVVDHLWLENGGDVNVKTGNLVIGTAGKGIDFSANTQQSGMTSELLNFYEEGSFTAHLYGATSGTGTVINSSNAVYTKIGNVVTIQMNWNNINTSSLSSNLIIKNLPFTAHSTNVGVSSPISHINLNQANLYLMINASTTTAEIFYNRAGTSYANETSPGVSGVYINITTTYRTA
tara:strand:- start:743 stop:1654 length:912 start_codon:yes stop_codon:yes gene_type:complete